MPLYTGPYEKEGGGGQVPRAQHMKGAQIRFEGCRLYLIYKCLHEKVSLHWAQCWHGTALNTTSGQGVGSQGDYIKKVHQFYAKYFQNYFVLLDKTKFGSLKKSRNFTP